MWLEPAVAGVKKATLQLVAIMRFWNAIQAIVTHLP
jgi:hypothetical protein